MPISASTRKSPDDDGVHRAIDSIEFAAMQIVLAVLFA